MVSFITCVFIQLKGFFGVVNLYVSVQLDLANHVSKA